MWQGCYNKSCILSGTGIFVILECGYLSILANFDLLVPIWLSSCCSVLLVLLDVSEPPNLDKYSQMLPSKYWCFVTNTRTSSRQGSEFEASLISRSVTQIAEFPLFFFFTWSALACTSKCQSLCHFLDVCPFSSIFWIPKFYLSNTPHSKVSLLAGLAIMYSSSSAQPILSALSPSVHLCSCLTM